MSLPYITAIVTAYDRKQYIRQALDSIYRQTLDKDKFEVIVVANYEDINYDKLKYNWIYTKDPRLGTKIVLGSKEAKGEVISLLEDDDYWLKDKLKFVYNKFKEYNLDYLRHQVLITDENLKPLDKNYQPRNSIFFDRIFYSKKINKKLINLMFIVWNNSSINIKKDIIEFISNKLKCLKMYETDKLINISSLIFGNKILFSSKRLSLYRMHNSSSTILKDWSNYYDNNRKNIRYKLLLAIDTLIMYRIVKSYMEQKLKNNWNLESYKNRVYDSYYKYKFRKDNEDFRELKHYAVKQILNNFLKIHDYDFFEYLKVLKIPICDLFSIKSELNINCPYFNNPIYLIKNLIRL
ncbi:Glycosyl transferase family 2 [Caldisphaera lagunensis DSM 15908]|uniref:Glycosyl transferase family 2 n=1 Tax=Caldisphaera lagunensis (strain DSM 15908 / JCM 11604 / ANMR 0165 / IC-154) TaxID=1056495 RepID=L0A9S9_CALLD|nr:glycosyltransferase family A protein [Caldisphaera lagunensis]AFZ70648.1 Glycosyl transferase family 2 [Caldisphaera lagunensis DSM 15908]